MTTSDIDVWLMLGAVAPFVKVRERIHEERCLRGRMMVDKFGVSRETIRKIVVENLDKRNVASHLVPLVSRPQRVLIPLKLCGIFIW